MGFGGGEGWIGALLVVVMSMLREGRERVCLLGGDGETTSLALESESEILSPRILCYRDGVLWIEYDGDESG